MRIVITDSGLGGLSVCANLHSHLKNNKTLPGIEIKYINAVPDLNYGYNSMGSRPEKIAVFDRFLQAVESKFSPHAIYIACNSLSVIFNETQFSKSSPVPVNGIVGDGTRLILQSLSDLPDSGVIILGTETTINENTYENELVTAGQDNSRIVSQVCPGLANAISNDPSGKIVKRMIDDYLSQALEIFTRTHENYLIYLGCTHYGYRRELFQQAIVDLGINASLVIPNDHAHLSLLDMQVDSTEDSSISKLSVEFITRYDIPRTEIKTLSSFLELISPETVTALQNYTLKPDLF